MDKDYHEPKTGIVYSTWMMTCPRHHPCMKKRRVGKLTTRAFGSIEPMAFLDAWKDLPDSDAADWAHNVADVPQALVEAKMAVPENVAAYREMMALFDIEG